MRLAELTTLAAAGYVLVLIGNAAVHARWRAARPRPADRSLREIRASFYRKLFLAFVLASIFPVLILAVVIRTVFRRACSFPTSRGGDRARPPSPSG